VSDGYAKTITEIAANVAVVCACILAALVLWSRLDSGPVGVELNVSVGQRIEPPSAIDFGTAATTMLIGLHSACRYCTQSMPAIKALAEVAARDPRALQIAPLSREPIADLDQYLQAHGLGLQGLMLQPDSALFGAVARTPTVVIVDRNGVVQETKVGLIDEALADHWIRRFAEQ
jgi:hypothetical protein